MRAISERLELTLKEVRAFLREGEVIPLEPESGDEENVQPEDVILEALIDAAKEAADDYCNNPFVDKDGNELPIPARIKLWCLKWVARQYENRPSGLVQEQISGLGALTWGSVDYTDLMPYRRIPGL